RAGHVGRDGRHQPLGGGVVGVRGLVELAGPALHGRELVAGLFEPPLGALGGLLLLDAGVASAGGGFLLSFAEQRAAGLVERFRAQPELLFPVLRLRVAQPILGAGELGLHLRDGGLGLLGQLAESGAKLPQAVEGFNANAVAHAELASRVQARGWSASAAARTSPPPDASPRPASPGARRAPCPPPALLRAQRWR